jgi:hypothetical protein
MQKLELFLSFLSNSIQSLIFDINVDIIFSSILFLILTLTYFSSFNLIILQYNDIIDTIDNLSLFYFGDTLVFMFLLSFISIVYMMLGIFIDVSLSILVKLNIISTFSYKTLYYLLLLAVFLLILNFNLLIYNQYLIFYLTIINIFFFIDLVLLYIL